MRKFIFLALGMFSVGSSTFMIAGLLPLIGQTIGQSISVTGQGITFFGLTYLFSAPFFSVVLANKSAKRTLQFALVVFLLGNLITAFSEDIAPFLIGRILTGLGAGIFNPLCVGIAVQHVDPSTRGKTLSLIWGANSAGAVLGVPLGIHLSSIWGWQFSVGCVFVSGLITLIGFSLQKVNIDLPRADPMVDRLHILREPKLLSVLGVTCFTSLASLGLYSYVAPIGAGAPHSLSISLFCWGLGGFFGSSTVGFFVDKMQNPQAVMAIILMGLGLILITLPFTIHLPYIGLLSFFLWRALGWATPTPQQHVLFDMCPRQKTILSALNSSAIGLGSSLGTALGGVLIGTGLRANHLPFFAAALLAGVALYQIMQIKLFPTRRLVRE